MTLHGSAFKKNYTILLTEIFLCTFKNLNAFCGVSTRDLFIEIMVN